MKVEGIFLFIFLILIQNAECRGKDSISFILSKANNIKLNGKQKNSVPEFMKQVYLKENNNLLRTTRRMVINFRNTGKKNSRKKYMITFSSN